MNTQYKKGVIELLVLLATKDQDQYGYDLVKQVMEVFEINEGTLYPLLKRLSNEKYFETYLKESSDGPPRKYYHLTSLGKEALQTQLKQWKEFEQGVNKFIERKLNND